MALLPYSLEIEALDLGADVKAVGLELIETGSREPLRGPEAAQIWSAALPVIAGKEPWALDFFSHVDRVHDFCRLHAIPFRGATERCCVVPAPEPEQLAEVFERFEGETFGIRAGGPLESGDADLEAGLARRGVDAYHPAFPRYFFCAVCDFENGFLTLLSKHLWASEVIRRVRPAVEHLQVSVARPQRISLLDTEKQQAHHAKNKKSLGGSPMSFDQAIETLSRDERFKATVYAMNTLLIQKSVYTRQEFEKLFVEWAQKEMRKKSDSSHAASSTPAFG